MLIIIFGSKKSLYNVREYLAVDTTLCPVILKVCRNNVDWNLVLFTPVSALVVLGVIKSSDHVDLHVDLSYTDTNKDINIYKKTVSWHAYAYYNNYYNGTIRGPHGVDYTAFMYLVI